MTPFRFPLIALCLLLCTCVSAQNDWQDGHYVDRSGTRTEGQIDHSFFGDRVETVRFRAAENAAVQTLSVSELQFFAAGEDRWLVRDVTVNTSPRAVGSLVARANLETTTLRGALRVLYLGAAELYFLTDPGGQAQFFARKPGGELTYLPFARYREAAEGGASARSDNSFRFTLSQILDDCPDIKSLVKNTDYTRASLERLFKQYYDCTGAEPEYATARKRGTFSYGPVLGANFSTHQHTNFPNFIPRLRWDDPSATGFTAGVMVRYHPGGKTRAGIKAGLLASRASIEMTAPPIDPSAFPEGIMRLYNYEETFVQLQAGLEYLLIPGKVGVALEGGLQLEYYLTLKETRQQDGFDRFPETRTELDESGYTKAGVYAGLVFPVGRAALILRVSTQRNRYLPEDRSNDREHLIRRGFLLLNYTL